MARIKSKHACLQLNGRAGDALCVGDDVIVVIRGIEGDFVRLNIIAPREMRIDQPEHRLHAQLLRVFGGG